jgi:hypothetical protein
MKPYKYYAIRVGQTIVVRKSLNGLKQITSRFYSVKNGLDIKQVTYTGGIVVGTLDVRLWAKLKGTIVTTFKPLTRDEAKGLIPYYDKDK